MTGLPVASATVASNVVLATPSPAKVVGLAPSALVVPLGAPVKNVTGVVTLTPAKLAVTVTVCAMVLLKVTEQTPEALVLHVVALKLVLEPVLLKVTACPLIGLLVMSATVTCKVLVVTPSSAKALGLAVNALVALFGAPGTNDTPAVFVNPAKVAVTVTDCAIVLFNVTEHVPAATVVQVPALNVVAVPVTLNVTA